MENSTIGFPEILRALRGDKTQKDVAKELNITHQSLSFYESGKRKPDIEVLTQIAKYYHVSTDYLLGLTKVKNPDIEIRAISEKTGLSQQAVDTIRRYKEEASDLLTALNFLIEDKHFKEALSCLDEYKYDFMRARFPAITFQEAVTSGERLKENDILKLEQSADLISASEYYIVKSFQKVIDSWVDSKAEEIKNTSPEEMKRQLHDHANKKFRLG